MNILYRILFAFLYLLSLLPLRLLYLLSDIRIFFFVFGDCCASGAEDIPEASFLGHNAGFVNQASVIRCVIV